MIYLRRKQVTSLESQKRVVGAVKAAMDAEGMRIVQNNGVEAGQVVFHLHVHVIPMRPHNELSHDGAYRDKRAHAVKRRWNRMRS